MTRRAVPAGALAGLAMPRGVTLRPAEPEDTPAVQEVYRTLARSTSGLMERAEPIYGTSAEAVLGR